VIFDPYLIFEKRSWKAYQSLRFVQSIGEASWIVQCPGKAASFNVIFQSNPYLHSNLLILVAIIVMEIA
jgi:hypothetical protein